MEEDRKSCIYLQVVKKVTITSTLEFGTCSPINFLYLSLFPDYWILAMETTVSGEYHRTK